MIIGKVQVSGSRTKAKDLCPITTGMVGAEVELEFSKEWAGLSKTAVFRVGEKALDVLVTGNTVEIPSEVLKITGNYVWLGLYGVAQSGEVIIPTVWANLGMIWLGVELSGEKPYAESPLLWQQMLATVGALEQLKTQNRGSLVAAVNELAMKESGGSAYDIAVKNGFVGTEAHWLASLKGDKGDTGSAGTGGAAGKNGFSIYVCSDAAGAASGAVTLDKVTVPAGHTVGTGDLIICSGYLYTVTNAAGGSVYLRFLDKLASSGGGAMDTTAVSLLIQILRNAVFTTNQSSNITALATALERESDVPVVPEEPDQPEEPEEPAETYYTITNWLTNVKTDNAVSSVLEGEAFAAQLTADDGYVMDAVTVTMGGNDITASCYHDGLVNIGTVIGNVVITAAAVKEAGGDSGSQSVTMTKAEVPYRWDQNMEYADGGNTEYTAPKGSGAAPIWYSDVFASDTVVTVSILYGTTNANLRQYCACLAADTTIPESGNLNASVYYMEQIGTADVVEYSAQYTVRAGYRLAIINYNNGVPNSIKVTA